jgi:hypothetical protein
MVVKSIVRINDKLSSRLEKITFINLVKSLRKKFKTFNYKNINYEQLKKLSKVLKQHENEISFCSMDLS